MSGNIRPVSPNAVQLGLTINLLIRFAFSFKMRVIRLGSFKFHYTMSHHTFEAIEEALRSQAGLAVS